MGSYPFFGYALADLLDPVSKLLVYLYFNLTSSSNPGRRFYWITTIIGWIIPGAVFTAAIVATGVSFRFGPNICHINHANSMADFWSWLMVMTGITVLIQTATIVYCVKIYFSNLMSDKSGPETATVPAPSIASSKRKPTVRPLSYLKPNSKTNFISRPRPSTTD